MIELETNLIQEWRDQSGKFASCENEEIMKADDKVTKQNEQIVLQKRMIQLDIMAEQLRKLTLACNKAESEYQKESHPFCTRIKRRTWEGEDINFNKYNGASDPRMHIVVFKESACSHLHDIDMLARLFLSNLGKEGSKWFYNLEDQSITSYSQLK